MSFVHEDPQFEQLLAIVARDTGIAEALIEKDYWVTHTLWALHETGLAILRPSFPTGSVGSGQGEARGLKTSSCPS